MHAVGIDGDCPLRSQFIGLRGSYFIHDHADAPVELLSIGGVLHDDLVAWLSDSLWRDSAGSAKAG